MEPISVNVRQGWKADTSFLVSAALSDEGIPANNKDVASRPRGSSNPNQCACA